MKNSIVATAFVMLLALPCMAGLPWLDPSNPDGAWSILHPRASPESKLSVEHYPSPPNNAVLSQNSGSGWEKGVWEINQSNGFKGKMRFDGNGTGKIKWESENGTRNLNYRCGELPYASRKSNMSKSNYAAISFEIDGQGTYIAVCCDTGRGLTLEEGTTTSRDSRRPDRATWTARKATSR